jgi:hypothetical protein
MNERKLKLKRILESDSGENSISERLVSHTSVDN